MTYIHIYIFIYLQLRNLGNQKKYRSGMGFTTHNNGLTNLHVYVFMV